MSHSEHGGDASGEFTMFGSQFVHQRCTNGGGEGVKYTVQIHSNEGTHVEPQTCVSLTGEMDGSDPTPSQMQLEGNVSGNSNMFAEIVAQPWPKGWPLRLVQSGWSCNEHM